MMIRLLPLLLCPSLFAFDLPGTPGSLKRMTAHEMERIVRAEADPFHAEGSVFQFAAYEVPMLLVYDVNHNRMRIIAPITEVKDLEDGQLLRMLEANYHSALDAKYAVADGVVYATFIHPLAELQDHQLHDAIRQVATAALTFGTHYTSTGLSFGEAASEKQSGEARKATGKDGEK